MKVFYTQNNFIYLVNFQLLFCCLHQQVLMFGVYHLQHQTLMAWSDAHQLLQWMRRSVDQCIKYHVTTAIRYISGKQAALQEYVLKSIVQNQIPNQPQKTLSKSTTGTESELKSAVAEHARDHNHVIDWDSVKILERKTERSMRLVREACQVRMLNDGVSMNKDDGGYDLLHIWDPLLRSAVSTTKCSTPAQPGRRRAHQPCS